VIFYLVGVEFTTVEGFEVAIVSPHKQKSKDSTDRKSPISSEWKTPITTAWNEKSFFCFKKKIQLKDKDKNSSSTYF
jgi:hypothetical protein